MPVLLLNKSFDNGNGDVTSFLKANTGDRITATFDFQSSIMVQSSSSNYVYRDPIQNIIYWSNGDFEDEGFRYGDTVKIKIYNAGGTLLHNNSVTVVSVAGNALYVSSIPFWIDFTAGEIVQVSVDSSLGRKREGLLMDVNLVQNSFLCQFGRNA